MLLHMPYAIEILPEAGPAGLSEVEPVQLRQVLFGLDAVGEQFNGWKTWDQQYGIWWNMECDIIITCIWYKYDDNIIIILFIDHQHYCYPIIINNIIISIWWWNMMMGIWIMVG